MIHADRRRALARGRRAANLYDGTLRGGARRPAADARARSSTRRPQRTVYRYLAPDERRRRARLPVLLVPPLAAPAICFDLRRGCSLAEHLLAAGAPDLPASSTATIAFSDRDLGLEHWVEDVLPDGDPRA